jgi:hypothetical protein
MKFTSIVFAALVAATQFSSTFAVSYSASGTNQAVDTPAFPYKDTAVTINVANTDTVSKANDVDPTSIKDAFSAGDITAYTIGTVDTTGTKGAVAVVTSAGVPDQLKYTPASGFTGKDTFTYTFLVTPKTGGEYGVSSESASATVTVTVSATPIKPTVIKQTFEIPGLVSSGDVVKSTQVGLSNIAAFTPGAPDAGVFKAIAMPVIGGSADFAANTSTEVVQQNFSTIFNSFYNFFRGGN